MSENTIQYKFEGGKKFTKIIAPLASLFALLYFSWPYLYLDLWVDELNSLKNYALQNFITTVTYYPVPNNHIFFNLFNNFLTRIIGIRDFHELLDHIHLLRMVQVVFSVATLYFVYKFTQKFIDQPTAWISSIILATSIPFLNHSTQLRGYNFAMLFTIMVTYFSFSYLKEQRKSYLALTTFSLFLLLYTVPSNIYFAIGLGLILSGQWLMNYLQNPNLTTFERCFVAKKNKALWPLIAATGLGVFLAILAYLPVLENLLGNRWVTRTPPTRFFSLTKRLPDFMAGMVSGRSILGLLFLIGVPYLFYAKNQKKNRNLWLILALLCIIPFFISFLRFDHPFIRSFINLCPILVIVMAIPLGQLLVNFVNHKKWNDMAMAVFYLFCIGACFVETNNIQDQLGSNLIKGKKAQNSYHNYYQSSTYHPLQAAQELLPHYKANPYPVIIKTSYDAFTFVEYLNKYRINSYFLKDFKKGPNPKGKFRIKKSTFKNGVHTTRTLNHKIKDKRKRKATSKIWQYVKLINYLNQEEDLGNFYFVETYDEYFWDEIAPFYKNKYDIKKLNELENSYNIYQFILKDKIQQNQKISKRIK